MSPRLAEPSIRKLPSSVASRIAAGEVVENPASVLKELLENSIDAGATKINVHFDKAGKTLLRVSDDGRGMPPEDLRLSVERHATSKLERIDDLASLSTFGFRDEALFAIGAVARLAIQSTPSRKRSGWRLEVSGGKIQLDREAPPAPGTVIEVRDLFFNTPARLKFLRSDAYERGKLLRVVEDAALSHPRISFAVSSGKTRPLKFPAQKESNLASGSERVRHVLGKESTAEMLAVEKRGAPFSLRAYVSPSHQLLASRGLQRFFINDRPVDSAILRQALYKAYEDYLPKGKHPVAVLYLQVPTDSVDVNVHPQKREVRFRSDNEVFNFIQDALQEKIFSEKQAPPLRFGERETENETFFEAAPRSGEPPFPGGTVPERFRGKIFEARNKDRPPRAYPSAPAPVARVSESPARYGRAKKASTPALLGRRDPAWPKWYRPPMRLLGQIERSYLAFEADGGLVLIDQHAAAERVLFERFLNDLALGHPAIQKLMIPHTIEMPPSRLEKALRWKDVLAEHGFDVEASGKRSLLVHTVPTLFELDEGEMRDFIDRLVDEVGEPKKLRGEIKNHQIATRACKCAIKAHDPIGEAEARQLIEDLKGCKDSFACPHGRPAVLELNRDELARRFKRPGAPPRK